MIVYGSCSPLPGKRLGDGLGPGGLVVQPQLGPGPGAGAEVEQVVEAGVQEVEQQPPPAQCGHVLGHRLGVEMSTNLSQCLEEAPTTRASLLKVPTSAFTVKNPLRHYAKWAS